MGVELADKIVRKLQKRLPQVDWSHEQLDIIKDGQPNSRTVIVAKYQEEELGISLGDKPHLKRSQKNIIDTILINTQAKWEELSHVQS